MTRAGIVAGIAPPRSSGASVLEVGAYFLLPSSAPEGSWAVTPEGVWRFDSRPYLGWIPHIFYARPYLQDHSFNDCKLLLEDASVPATWSTTGTVTKSVGLPYDLDGTAADASMEMPLNFSTLRVGVLFRADVITASTDGPYILAAQDPGTGTEIVPTWHLAQGGTANQARGYVSGGVYSGDGVLPFSNASRLWGVWDWSDPESVSYLHSSGQPDRTTTLERQDAHTTAGPLTLLQLAAPGSAGGSRLNIYELHAFVL